MASVCRVFQEEVSLDDHRGCYAQSPLTYLAAAGLQLTLVEVPHKNKVHALLLAFEKKDPHLAQMLLGSNQYQFTEVYAAAKILDAQRKIRETRRRITQLERQLVELAKKRPRPSRSKKQLAASGEIEASLRKQVGQLKSDINDLERLDATTATLTSSVQKRLRQWCRRIPDHTLVHYLLQFPTRPWRELADVIHLRPGDFSIDWFLGCCFGADPPKDSLPDVKGRLTIANLATVLPKHNFPFTFIRKHFAKEKLSDRIKAAVGAYSDLDTLIWWHEDLACDEVDAAISAKIARGERPSFSYGKLMERLMYFHRIKSPLYAALVPVAENRLAECCLPIDTPMAVLGDCSGSMHVAVRTASIVASVLTYIGSSELLFFNGGPLPPPLVPTTVKDVLLVSHFTRAQGSTAPASALEHFLLKKKTLASVIVVTDEEEEDQGKELGLSFCQTLRRYRDEVCATTRVVLISFLEKNAKGRMLSDLESANIPTVQFRFNGERPDLSKLDALLGQLATLSTGFGLTLELVARAASVLRPQELLDTLQKELRAKGKGFFLWLALHLLEHPALSEEDTKAVADVVSRHAASAAPGAPVTRLLKQLSELPATNRAEAVRRLAGEYVPIACDGRLLLTVPQIHVGTNCAFLSADTRAIAFTFFTVRDLHALRGVCRVFNRTALELIFDYSANPETDIGKWSKQLAILGEAGFPDVDVNIAALERAKGDVETAFAILLGAEEEVAQADPQRYRYR